ncbi:hypothetical protein BDZ90DRAFT_184614 [Jaminaea rosea]|uniref:Uncharacterized protein n=1 Tax=Jaminaea rosea TaxID=1569628 RepID=A0A316UQJ2_9BASI|nr:hypothetical protein BDZ90DRAFT_184614 [Jaminaea rosea]PWN27058.1 hypothetical protein BDZ90DRAFT_184614 [Jaminaea rosea]
MSRIARWGQAALHTLPRQQISLAAPAQPSRRCYSNDYDGQDDGSGPSTSCFQSPESQHPRSDRHQNRGPSTSIAPPPDGYDLLLSQFEAGSALAKPTHSNDELNLSLLRKLRPLPGKQRKHFRGERLREKAQMEEKLWQKSIERVSNAFGLPQVRKLAREAGLEGQIVRGKKQVIVAALVEKVFGYKPPRTLESTAAGRSGSYDQAIGQLSSASHEVSQTDLFLLLADGGAKLNQLAGTFGTRLTPRVSTDEEGRNVYSIEARGDEQQVGAPIEKALQSVSELKILQRVTLQLPRAALDPKTIRYIASRTGCFIEYTTTPSGPNANPHETTLDLWAFRASSHTYARICLAAFQADLYQGARPLLSFAKRSHSDPDYAPSDESSHQMERYCFHPHALASPQSWLTQLTAGGSSAQMFRLGRLRGSRGGLLGRGDDDATQASTLVELETGNALGAERNWAWLEEYMAADKLDLVSSSTAGEAGGLTTSYSLTAGTLAFPGPQSPPEDVGSVLSHLASLLSPPLPGSWPLDTAYQWLRNRDPQAPFERRPLWVPGQLPGVASDLEGSMGEGVKRLLSSEVQEGDSDEAAAASQREVLRMTYRVQTKDGEDIEPIYRLVVDIEERESEAVAEEAANTATLDAHLDGAAAEPSVSSTPVLHPYNYRVVSAHVTTAREADILAPEHKSDLRLTTRKDRQLTFFELESLAASLQPYLEQMQSSVGESVVKRRTKRMEEEQRRGGSEAAEHSSSPLAPAARKQEAYSSTEELQRNWRATLKGSRGFMKLLGR